MSVLNFGGRGHTCVIYSQDEGNVLEYGRRAPAFRVLVNTSAPQGSTGITTEVFPSMTLGCGAIAGNSTGDNIGPMHLFHVKRIAWKVRSVEEAFVSDEAKRYFAAVASGSDFGAGSRGPTGRDVDRSSGVAARVDKYLANRGTHRPSPQPRRTAGDSVVASVVDRFLRDKSAGTPANAPMSSPAPDPNPPPPSPVIRPVSFVCEGDMRKAIHSGARIYIAKHTIVTPAARDLDIDGSILVQTEA